MSHKEGPPRKKTRRERQRARPSRFIEEEENAQPTVTNTQNTTVNRQNNTERGTGVENSFREQFMSMMTEAMPMIAEAVVKAINQTSSMVNTSRQPTQVEPVPGPSSTDDNILPDSNNVQVQAPQIQDGVINDMLGQANGIEKTDNQRRNNVGIARPLDIDDRLFQNSSRDGPGANRYNSPSSTTLVSTAHEILAGALTETSKRGYKKAIDVYKMFLSQYFPSSSVLPLTVESIVLFIAYCKLKNLSFNTISTYISMLNYFQKMSNFSDISKSFVVKKALEGLRKLKAKPDNRLPITPLILEKLVEALSHLGICKFYQVLLKSMFLIAFHAFLRIGEITDNGRQNHNIQFSAITFNMRDKTPNDIEINMQQFKHSVGKSCFKLNINRNDKKGELCPVQALWEYCRIRGNKSGPLFCFFDGTPIPRSFFSKNLQMALCWANCDTHRYKGHSFRIGAASCAAAMGISDDKIQVMGRWHSNSFKKYIRIPVLQL